MHAFHGNGLGRRYEHILKFVSPKDSVLDVGCGTGTFQSYLNGNDYLGLELNDNFISYAKGKNRNVIKQDATTFDRYGDFDVCIVIDFLHHLNPKHGELMEKALSGIRKRVIVCEPYEFSGRHPIVKELIKILDSDGMNNSGEWGNRGELLKFYEKFKPSRVDELDHSIIAVYEKNDWKETD